MGEVPFRVVCKLVFLLCVVIVLTGVLFFLFRFHLRTSPETEVASVPALSASEVEAVNSRLYLWEYLLEGLKVQHNSQIAIREILPEWEDIRKAKPTICPFSVIHQDIIPDLYKVFSDWYKKLDLKHCDVYQRREFYISHYGFSVYSEKPVNMLLLDLCFDVQKGRLIDHPYFIALDKTRYFGHIREEDILFMDFFKKGKETFKNQVSGYEKYHELVTIHPLPLGQIENSAKSFLLKERTPLRIMKNLSLISKEDMALAEPLVVTPDFLRDATGKLQKGKCAGLILELKRILASSGVGKLHSLTLYPAKFSNVAASIRGCYYRIPVRIEAFCDYSNALALVKAINQSEYMFRINIVGVNCEQMLEKYDEIVKDDLLFKDAKCVFLVDFITSREGWERYGINCEYSKDGKLLSKKYLINGKESSKEQWLEWAKKYPAIAKEPEDSFFHQWSKYIFSSIAGLLFIGIGILTASLLHKKKLITEK